MTGDVQYDGEQVRRPVSVVQHVVRNVTTLVRSWSRRFDVWMLVAAAIAVPLLAALQYRWLSDLAAAQRMELRQRWADAVARSAAAIDDDLAAFYADVLGIARTQPDIDTFTRAVGAWTDAATTLGPLARPYLHESRSGRWVALGATSDIDHDTPPVDRSVGFGMPLSASWLPPAGERTLPSLMVTLDGESPDVDAVLLSFDQGACKQLLRRIAGRDFDVTAQVQLAVSDDQSRQLVCADPQFDRGQRDDASAAVFRLRPLPFARGDRRGGMSAPGRVGARPGVGVAMSQSMGAVSWSLHAQPASESRSAGALGLQTRNLWTAAALELTLVVAIVAVAVAGRRARRTAATHVRVAAMVAHELRTPLAAIKVLAQNQARGAIHDTQQIERYGVTIANEVDRLHLFVERILHFTAGRGANGFTSVEAVDFERVLTQAAHPLEGQIAATGVTIESSVEPLARFTRGDEGALMLAVRNLVQNALDHAAGARTILITVRKQKRHAVVSVTDDGAGVPESERPTVFEPFVRGNGTGQRGVPGHGIGLALVRDVARAHGGRAWYEPGSKTGSTFSFTVLIRGTGHP
jgi:signal transduction histidine kinase